MLFRSVRIPRSGNGLPCRRVNDPDATRCSAGGGDVCHRDVRGAAITDVQHLLGHSSVKTTEQAYAAFVQNERFRQTIDLLDQTVMPRLKFVK